MPATTFALRPVGCLAGLGSGPRARPSISNTYAGGVGNGCWAGGFVRCRYTCELSDPLNRRIESPAMSCESGVAATSGW